jgi:hypothetical protein
VLTGWSSGRAASTGTKLLEDAASVRRWGASLRTLRALSGVMLFPLLAKVSWTGGWTGWRGRPEQLATLE